MVSFKLHADYHRPCCSIFEHTTEMFTVRKRSCRTVMFLHLSVSLFPGGCIPACTGQGVSTSARQTPPLRKHLLDRHPQANTPWADTPQDSYCSRRYTSYWNAFLFVLIFGGHISFYGATYSGGPKGAPPARTPYHPLSKFFSISCKIIGWRPLLWRILDLPLTDIPVLDCW